MKKLTREEFIEKAIKVHGNKYDYSKVNYVNSRTKVCIICPEHGEFWQEPKKHLQNRGCRKCKYALQSVKLRSTKEDFVQKAKMIHGDKYNYDKVNYKTRKFPVLITCPIHGDFYLKPGDHLKGHGCPYCPPKNFKNLKHLFIKLKLIFNSENILEEANPEWLNPLRFDIYFPDYNIAIEYNGKLHYHPIKIFGGEQKFKKQLLLDLLKVYKCNNNNCKLFILKYNYTEIDFDNLVNNINTIIKFYKNEN